MATSTILSNPVVTIGGIDMTDQTTAATLTRTVEALESTAFGSTSRVYTGGLENNELTVTMYLNFYGRGWSFSRHSQISKDRQFR